MIKYDQNACVYEWTNKGMKEERNKTKEKILQKNVWQG